MSISLIATYRTPEDTTAFDAHYRDVHTPLVLKIPGLQSVRVQRASKHLFGEDQPFMIVEMRFPDRATFETALASDENKAAGRDIMNFAKGLVSLTVAEGEDILP